ncbi:hypothetical protein STEG23_031506, partial [Scotinomys teguina]
MRDTSWWDACFILEDSHGCSTPWPSPMLYLQRREGSTTHPSPTVIKPERAIQP